MQKALFNNTLLVCSAFLINVLKEPLLKLICYVNNQYRSTLDTLYSNHFDLKQKLIPSSSKLSEAMPCRDVLKHQAQIPVVIML
jgi:hypothetical protein